MHIVAICLFFLVYIILEMYIRITPIKVAESFIYAVASGNTSAALKFSSGSAALITKKMDSQADVVQVRVVAPHISRN